MTKRTNLPLTDRRKSPRRAVSQVARLELDDGSNVAPPGVLVIDNSDGGARLFVRDVDIPNRFTLIFAESGIRRECRMIWRVGPEVGVKFVDELAAKGKRRRPLVRVR